MPRAMSSPSRLLLRQHPSTNLTTSLANINITSTACRSCFLRRQLSAIPLLSARPLRPLRPSSSVFYFSSSATRASSSPSEPPKASKASKASEALPLSPEKAASQAASGLQAAGLTESQYNSLADDCLDRMLVRLEEMQDAREDVDVEFSAGVLTLTFSTAGDGSSSGTRTYVVNKQPPNKQIWLSSPKSGPKRYDWVARPSEREGGSWIYLKDGSTLYGLLRDEIGIDLDESE